MKIMNNTLIMTVGLPRSGKSTWARKQEHLIVNPDSIRLAIHGQAFIEDTEPIVWTITKYMVKALFLAGHNKVILDATNTTKEARDFWISDDWKCIYHLFLASKSECIERAIKDDKEYLIPVIERMSEEIDYNTEE